VPRAGAPVAVIDGRGAALRAIGAAALALPGLAPAAARANGSEGASIHHSRYREGERNLQGVESAADPIEVDSLQANTSALFLDRVRLDLHFAQDTWSGATPIATAPRALGGNRPTAPDGVSSATPFLERSLYFDSELQPLASDGSGGFRLERDPQLVHTLSTASPETRRELDLALGYEWNEARASIGAGVSLEDDYESRSVTLSGAVDLFQKRPTLDARLRYTDSRIDATLDHDAVPYIDTRAFADRIEAHPLGVRVLRDERNDVSLALGLTQVLSRSAILELTLGASRAAGYLENPYRVVEAAFLDPDQQFLAPPGGIYGQVHALLEQRPDRRHEWSAGLRLVHEIELARAAASVSYRYAGDDWEVHAHRFEADWRQPLGAGFTLTPRIRHYPQSAADFYAPYLVSAQAFETVVSDDDGNIVSITPYDPRLLPGHYSSDHRLSAFGAISGGLTLSKRFAKGILLEADFEYYSHGGSLALGGDGEGSYADFDWYTLSAGIRIDTTALSLARADADSTHVAHGFLHPPAGVMSAHHLAAAGSFMLGYRFQFLRQAGNLLSGAHAAPDAEVVASACGGSPCGNAPERMDMFMHMLELSYAPTDWLDLMLMPSFVDMDMRLRPLAGVVVDVHSSHLSHRTGGLGDLSLGALVRVYQGSDQRLHAGLGLSAPTGDVDVKLRRDHQENRGFLHYGMQLGSGTWDLTPSLTWTARWRRLGFGAQVSGITRLERENESGYALGDVFQSTAWGGVALLPWLETTLRVLYTWQDEIEGRFDGLHPESTPPDFTANDGGRFVDLGFGIGAVVPEGVFAGHRLAVEWLQPVSDRPRGVQLERVGTLQVSWGVDF
jgi:hypothetical protein